LRQLLDPFQTEVQHKAWETAPEAVGRRGTMSLHQRWVEALLLPGTEIQGSGQELMDFAVEIGRWREPLFRLPKVELGDDAPAISLPPGGKGFWESGELPEPLDCPVIPRTPAAILERVGEFPNWCGKRSLCESLTPVYQAAILVNQPLHDPSMVCV
jgi:hypothetical protein